MMHMTFYWGTKMTLLFDSWRTESWPSYSLTLLVCFLFALFYQYMEDRRLSFLATGIAKPTQPSSIHAPLTPYRDHHLGTGLTKTARLATSILVAFNSGLAYMLMLAVMTFNWGVLIVIVLGFGVGYFLFRAKEYEALIVEDTCACS